jgi:hypothetical protein
MEHEGKEWKLPISSIKLLDQPLVASSNLFGESIQFYEGLYGLPFGEDSGSESGNEGALRGSVGGTIGPQPQIISPQSAWWRRDSLYIRVEQEKVLDLDIPLLRLHVPRYADCTACFRTTSGTQGNWKINFSILGVGNSVLAKFEQAQMTEVNASQCIEVVQPGRIKVQTGPLFLNDRPLAVQGIRALISELKP